MNTLSTTFSTPLSCPIFPSCSGCILMGDTTLISERTIVEEWAKKRKVPFVFKALSPYRYRIRTKLPCRKVLGKIELGLFKRGTHDLVPMPRCPLHTDPINEVIAPLKELFEHHQLIPYNEEKGLGELRAVQITENRKGVLQLALSFFTLGDDRSALFNDVLRLRKDLSLWVNLHPNPTSNVLFSNDWKHIGGAKEFWIPFGKEEFPFHPGSFVQSNPLLFEVLLEDLEEIITPGAKIVDLFAGVGVIGSQFATKAKEVLLVESNPLSQEMFDLFQKKTNHANLHFKSQGAESFDEIGSYDVLIVDPPRKGLSRHFKENLRLSAIETLVYISCSLPSLLRDLEEFEGDYQVITLKSYLLFPGTDHIETVAILKKK